MSKRFLGALVALIGWGLFAPASWTGMVQGGQILNANGTLPAGQYCTVPPRNNGKYLEKRHTVNLVSGNQYTIDCISTTPYTSWQANVDTYIYLVPTGTNTVIDQNDDVILGGDLRSRIMFDATADGTYDIVVTAWANIGYGQNLTATPPNPGFDGVIAYNVTVEERGIIGAINGTAIPDASNPLATGGSSPMTGRNTVSLTAGTTYRIDVTGENGDYDYNVDTYLQLYDPNGSLVASCDNYGNGYASSISYPATATGTYTIIVTILTSGVSSYHLNVTTVNVASSSPITPLGTGTPNVRLTPRSRKSEPAGLPTLLLG